MARKEATAATDLNVPFPSGLEAVGDASAIDDG
jgi:hypothetical protein